MRSVFSRLLTAACALAGTAAAVETLEVLGKDFVNSKTQERFQIIGVDYQPGGSSGFSTSADPLSNATACLRDAALMQRLGINTVRVYNLYPLLDHSECASIFNAAGIYLLLDVNSPLTNGSLDRTDPSGTYDVAYFHQVFGIIESFKNFPNILGFFSGNEVINQDSVYEVPAYIRAVQRDMKDYIAKNVNRTIPVGYSAADVEDMLMDTVNYLSCNLTNSTESRSDFFGLNDYSWCGNSSYTTSGYDTLVEDFANASLPAFFSEYGCNTVQPRYFTEVQALYGKDMIQSFSGGLVYEWTEESNDYGLVQLNDNGTVTLLVDYEHLRTQYDAIDLTLITESNSTQTSVEAVDCAADLISGDDFLNAFDLPARPSGVQDLIDNGYTKASVATMVAVTSTTIPETVYDASGAVITGIALKVEASDESNEPGGNTSGSTSSSDSSSSSSGSSTGTATGSAASSTKSGAADKLSTSAMLGGLLGALVATVATL
ncbi:hypothetical protein ASPZODRAFT_17975 [Penicilliopsis zonata CBS 506.65]|uniref:1,3-beta-glucanosyltransferase n=1 Tax=Penicilliopsis zonata CBS 506.65 TaxID=1073090 RepID=A0A1L9SD74_9EURO|nr:hypothetical protein ASPZODRAFT_17975 [Penicilliopsis zonata CBS 506.65]OJJ45063.1 hypothetical protein ASPZODRAFT_17975 [Penicilliopsis zonata CBS 506.65]